MNDNSNQVFIMKQIFNDFCVNIFSKSWDLPEPVSEPEPEPEPQGRNRNRKIIARFHNTAPKAPNFFWLCADRFRNYAAKYFTLKSLLTLKIFWLSADRFWNDAAKQYASISISAPKAHKNFGHCADRFWNDAAKYYASKSSSAAKAPKFFLTQTFLWNNWIFFIRVLIFQKISDSSWKFPTSNALPVLLY